MPLRAGVDTSHSRGEPPADPEQAACDEDAIGGETRFGKGRLGDDTTQPIEGVNIVAEEEREQQDTGADDEQGEQSAEGGDIGSVAKGAATGAVAGAAIGAAAAAAQSRLGGGSEGESDDPGDESDDDEAQ